LSKGRGAGRRKKAVMIEARPMKIIAGGWGSVDVSEVYFIYNNKKVNRA
jgi:hypothetical protein